MTKLSQRIQSVEPSPTLAITAKAKQMVADGIDVVSFGAGEPDFNTPAPIIEAAKRALDEGRTKYTPASGIPALREKIAEDYRRRGREVSADQVIVTVGGKHALYEANQVLFEQGDRVLVPAPYWVSYPEMAKLAGAEPVILETTADDGFKVTPDGLRAALGQGGVRGLILCSPSNPTGSTYTADELAALGKVLEDYEDVTIFFDAIYDRLYYDGEIAPDFAAVAPKLASRTITFNGFSKTFAMTGWRLGWAIADSEITGAIATLQSQSTSNPTSFAQYGALAALDLPDETIGEMRSVFRRRRDLIVEALNDIDGVRCDRPGGAFYVFPDFSDHLGDRFADDMALTRFLLEEARVAVVPGSAFGAPGNLRLSYATGDASIEEGLKRIRAALEG